MYHQLRINTLRRRPDSYLPSPQPRLDNHHAKHCLALQHLLRRSFIVLPRSRQHRQGVSLGPVSGVVNSSKCCHVLTHEANSKYNLRSTLNCCCQTCEIKPIFMDWFENLTTVEVSEVRSFHMGLGLGHTALNK